ncbi:MAG TPA: isoaspartyl peptidase/L-asparaginase, partial [Gammaproteobacteria bacterium]|nr:isoaspartyl peptidase/L-asparaginase [Gammaproteobacteria bacterium]
GAGAARDDGLDERRGEAIRAALAEVLAAGAAMLASGAASLDVVEDAVRRLEDSPLFNAGKGAVFNAHGEHELDASIMDGKDLRAGAVANVRGIKNPVALARLIMERSPHVLLQGAGAQTFATTHGMTLVGPDYFWTEERWNAFKEARLHSSTRGSRDLGTVGAVALDGRGDLAAATSTGGVTNKLPGRVGDSAVIGAGTYASNASCAVSCTGHGESFIRATIARDICALVEYTKVDAAKAAETVIGKRLAQIGGKGGVIVVGRDGGVACVFNTELMYRGYVTHDTPARTAIRSER